MATKTINRLTDLITKGRNGRVPGDLTFKMVDVTPELATQWLEKNQHNRPFSEAHATKLSRAMVGGQWECNGESIKFDEDGNVIDGQHRLFAILMSGTTQRMLVVLGVAAEVFHSLDQHRKRTLADNFALQGEKHYIVLAASAALLRRYERGDLWSTGIDRSVSALEGLEVLERHPGLRDSLHFHSHQPRYLPPSLIVFCHYVFSQRDPQLATEFFEQFCTGIGLKPMTAVYHLRERMISERVHETRLMDPRHKLAYVIKAWNKTVAGDVVKHFRWSFDAEGWPEIA